MKRKFNVDIVFVFAILMVITVFGIISVVYYQSKKSALADARKQFNQAARTLIEKSDNYLKTAQLSAEIATQLFLKKDLKLQVESEEASYLLKTLLTYKQISFIYYGDEKGSFIQAGYTVDGNYIKVIHRKDHKANTSWNFYNKQLTLKDKKFTEDSKYDPRVRPWYIGAKKSKRTFWSKPYIFFENNEPGITVAVPIYNANGQLKGIVAADISLEGISNFLKKGNITKNSISFIIDDNSKLVAYSRDRNIVATQNNKTRSLRPEELEVTEVTDAFKAYNNQYNKLITYSSKNRNYLVTCLPFTGSLERGWQLIILAPEDDFTGALKVTLKRILYFSFGALLIGILLTTLLARKISKPIELLSKDVLEVRNLNLDSDSCINSPIHEIQTMDNAINAMKTSLKAFRMYLPSTLVKQLIASGEDIAIGGKERDLTLFFSDIADFTSISETIEPQDLLLQLSEYFDTMTTIIEADKGTVDKFIGDAVMAFWGAPIKNVNHTYGACRSALLCQKKIEELNKKWSKESKEEFHTRIGIHTAKTIVGNIGAEQRMNYTVLGDGVNLASRLEGVNKLYKTKIIISHTTYQQIKNLFHCRILDNITVKGKNETIKIYELLGEIDDKESEKNADLASHFFNIYEKYTNREWVNALGELNKLQERHPDDYITEMYIKRCEDFIIKPPKNVWDGVIRIEVK